MKNIFYSAGIALVILFASCGKPTEACFTFSPGPPAPAGTMITFNSSCSLNGNGSFTWDFGDGSPKTTVNSTVVTHSYAAAGTYTASVTVGGSFQTMKKEHPEISQPITVQ